MYTGLAQIYDETMQHALYKDWMKYLLNYFPRLDNLTVADVGCGTGTLTVMLAEHAMEVIGIDISEEMLVQAAGRVGNQQRKVQWLCEDMRYLQLPKCADLIVSTCDSLNYLLTEQDVCLVFEAIRKNLRPGGVFCFDILGPARIAALRQGIWHDIADSYAIIYETEVSTDNFIYFDVHAFISEDGQSYERYEEQHIQKFYSPDFWISMLHQCGFQVESYHGDFQRTDIYQADRILFTAIAG